MNTVTLPREQYKEFLSTHKYALKCLREANVENAKLREALEAVEWIPEYSDNANLIGEYCPWCMNCSCADHKPDCQRQAALSPCGETGGSSETEQSDD